MLFLLVCVPAGWAHESDADLKWDDNHRITEPGSPFGVCWGFRWGYEGQYAGYHPVYMPVLREMNAGATKLYITWNQIEPEKGRYDWAALDAFASQLHSPTEGMIGFWTGSLWATRRKTPNIPGSPPKDPNDYYKAVNQMVSRYKGKIRYWQNDCEPSHKNYWDGTASEFAETTKLFYNAVKDADPQAVVVLGGHNGSFSPPPRKNTAAQLEGLEFFRVVIKEAGNFLDGFDVRLYRNLYDVPARVEYWRNVLAEFGYKKLIFCTEFNGPSLLSFPENVHFGLALKHVANDGGAKEKRVFEETYSNVAAQPPATQMYLHGCSEELEKKFRRLQNRDTVIRSVLMLSAGVQKSYFWCFEMPWNPDYKTMGSLMYGKMVLVDYNKGQVTHRYPLADAYQEIGKHLGDVELLIRIEVPRQKSIYLFEARRRGRGPVYVVWDRRDDLFAGEDEPAKQFGWPWKYSKAAAVDVLGKPVPVNVKDGILSLQVNADPIYIEPQSFGDQP